MVEYYHWHTKIMGLSLVVTVCTRIEKLANSLNDMTSSGSTVVKLIPYFPEIVGSRLTPMVSLG